jgi:hypothetical protein
MTIGFTGTREGMSDCQIHQFERIVLALSYNLLEFHHGDAAGADRQARDLISGSFSRYIEIVAHPAGPDPLARNREIVAESDILIAAPLTDKETIRSGTWATIRYARRAGIPVVQLSRGQS